jgi:tRNA A37 methylthiotransferase MiaB
MRIIFFTSLREKTHAHRQYQDDVPLQVKHRRLSEVIDVFQRNARHRMERFLGMPQIVLVEGASKRSSDLTGRADGNQRVNFEDVPVYASLAAFRRGVASPVMTENLNEKEKIQKGDYVLVMPTSATSVSIRALPMCKVDLHP